MLRQLPPAARAKLLALTLVLSACASGYEQNEFDDPLEPANRAVHGFNKGLDVIVLKPVSELYGVLPDPVEDMVSRAASNLGEPSDALNRLLQGNAEGVLVSIGRFLINSTIGIVGLFDPAKELGIPAEPTDFGETLHIWGVAEGAYVELPVLGPSTVRDALGRLVDTVTDPVAVLVGPPEIDYVLVTRTLDIADKRHRYSFVVDGILYESADSYAAARTAYLQNRRAKLQGEVEEEDIEDPFEFQ